MWTFNRCLLSAHRLCRQITRRDFMSPNFALTEVWDSRLNTKILHKVKIDEFYADLENRLSQKHSVTAVDVDIFANSVDSDYHLAELDDLVHKFRLTPEATNILPSTHHAFIRSFLRYGDQDELLRILDDRLNYGIFPDDFCSILLLDHYIKNEDFTKAAKIAVLQMLQEDFSNPLIKYLSLYSCHKYLLKPEQWYKEEEEEDKEEKKGEEEEEIKIRVGYLRNPFFDDHFDLKEPNSLIGKTLVLIGENLDGSLSSSYRLLGLILYQKYDKAENLIEGLIQNKQPIHLDCLSLIEENLKNVVPKEEAEKENQMNESVAKITRQIENLKTSAEILKENPLERIEGTIKQMVAERENDIISRQKKIYSDWVDDREELLMQEIAEINRKNRLEEVAKKKEELQKMEEQLFFFDNEDKLDITIENKRVPYPRKWLGKKKKKRADNVEYVPPEIVKQYQK